MPSTVPKVFLLIKSLNKSEITHFRKHAKRQNSDEKNEYYNIFEAMLSLESYDEQKLLSKLKKGKLPHLRVINSQLYSRITDKLHEFHVQSSIMQTVKKDLHIAEILLDKGLHKQVLKLLKKTRKTIEEYELFEHLPDLIKIEKLTWKATDYKNINKEDIIKLTHELVEGLKLQENLSLYREAHHIIRQWHLDEIFITSEKGKKVLEDFIKNPALDSPDKAASLRAKIEYYNTLATYHFMIGQPEIAYQYNQKLLDLYDKNDVLIQLFPGSYIITLNHHSVDSLNLNKREGYETGIKKMEDFLEKNTFKQTQNQKSKVFEMLYTLKFNVVFNTQDYKSGLELLEKFEPLYKIYESDIQPTPKVIFWYIITYILFFNKKYDEALGWVGRITQHRHNVAEKIQLAAYIIELVLKYETEYHYLDNHINNARNRIKGKRELYQSERQLFKMLKEVNNAPLFERKEVFKKHLPIIEELRQKSDEKSFYNYFDLLQWVQSKAEGKKFGD